MRFVLALAVQSAALSPWNGGWMRHEEHAPASIEITEATETGFKFLLESTSGANVGEISGEARLKQGDASYEEKADGTSEACKLDFGAILVAHHCDFTAEHHVDALSGIAFADQRVAVFRFEAHEAPHQVDALVEVTSASAA